MTNGNRWVGIDLHRRRSQIAIIDEQGELTLQRRIPTGRFYNPTEFEFASSKLNRTIATINTVFLITSSLTITLGIRSAKLGQRGALIRWLLVTALLGTLFMVMKGVEYAEDFHERYVPGSIFRGNTNPLNRS